MATTADWHIDVIAGMWSNVERPSKQRTLHEGRQKTRSRCLLQPWAGSYKLKGKNEQEVRQQAGEITERGWKRAEGCHPTWKLYTISFSTSPHFICNLLSSFPFVIQLFIFLASLYFQELSPILSHYFLYLFHHPFLSFSSSGSFCLSEGLYWLSPHPLLFQPMSVSMCTQSGRGFMCLLHFQSLT